jgi:thiol-disulfide isomerase/thioredoxin
MDVKFLSDKFSTALSYDKYLQTGNEEQQRRWTRVYEAASLTESQKQLLGGFVREMKILIVSGIWCGDCVEQCPLIARIAQANPEKIDLRLLDRDQNLDLAHQVRINGGDRVPAVLFLSEDFEFCGLYGDRTINRYRAIAQRKLGPACPTGIVGPDAQELNATLADWLAEIERIQLMLRLSPRLRSKCGD